MAKINQKFQVPEELIFDAHFKTGDKEEAISSQTGDKGEAISSQTGDKGEAISRQLTRGRLFPDL